MIQVLLFCVQLQSLRGQQWSSIKDASGGDSRVCGSEDVDDPAGEGLADDAPAQFLACQLILTLSISVTYSRRQALDVVHPRPRDLVVRLSHPEYP